MTDFVTAFTIPTMTLSGDRISWLAMFVDIKSPYFDVFIHPKIPKVRSQKKGKVKPQTAKFRHDKEHQSTENSGPGSNRQKSDQVPHPNLERCIIAWFSFGEDLISTWGPVNDTALHKNGREKNATNATTVMDGKGIEWVVDVQSFED